MTNFKEIQISEIFDIEKWKSLYTNTYITWNVGSFPVFSSKTTNNWEIWKINTYDYDKSCITWTTDWVHAWTVFIRENIKFSMTTHCWALILKKEYLEKISLSYIYYFLSVFLKQYAIWTDNKRITSWMIKDIFIKLPINESLEFDLEKQKEIALKYEKLEKLKDRIRIMKEDIESKRIDIFQFWRFEEFKFKDIFDLQNWYAFPSGIYTSNSTNSVKLIRIQDINSKSSSKEIRIPVDYEPWKLEKYFVETGNYLVSLSWAAGFHIRKYDWEVWYLNQRILKIKLKEKHINSFIKDFELILFSQIKNYLNSLWRWQNNNLSNKDIENATIKIPTKENGEFDLEKQKEIALKYEKIKKIQKTLIEELEYLEKVKVEI